MESLAQKFAELNKDVKVELNKSVGVKVDVVPKVEVQSKANTPDKPAQTQKLFPTGYRPVNPAYPVRKVDVPNKVYAKKGFGKALLCQESFLNGARQAKQKVSITFLSNDVTLEGCIVAFDNYSIIIETQDKKKIMVYKQLISFVELV